MQPLKKQINHLIHAGAASLPEHDPRKKIAIGVNQMSLVIAMINATVGVLAYLFTRNLSLFIGVIVEILLMGVPPLLNHHKRYTTASMALYIIVSLATCYFCCVLGRLAEAQLTIVYLVGLAMFLFSGTTSRGICIVIALMVLVVVELNFKYEFIRPLVAADNANYFIRGSAYLVVIFLVIFTFDLYWKNNRYLLLKLKEYASQVETNLKKEEDENKSKDKLISNATHEMRVSFYSIFSIINILYKYEKQADINLKRGIDDLRAACKYSKSIIDNILEYERFKAGLAGSVLHQLIDIRLLVLNIVDIYKYFADEKKVKIRYSVSDNIAQHIIGDEIKIRQIITNLLHNAIKFTPGNSTVYIRIAKTGNTLSIAVHDSGEGIKNENLKSIFEPFVTQNPDGLGLGLYIVREQVDALEGRIEVVSNFAEGTVFRIFLPLRDTVNHTSSVLSLT